MIVIQVRGFTVLRHRDYDRFFKGGGNHRGIHGLIKGGCKQTSKLISAGPQNTASNPIRSGCFPDIHSCGSALVNCITDCSVHPRFLIGECPYSYRFNSLLGWYVDIAYCYIRELTDVR